MIGFRLGREQGNLSFRCVSNTWEGNIVPVPVSARPLRSSVHYLPYVGKVRSFGKVKVLIDGWNEILSRHFNKVHIHIYIL